MNRHACVHVAAALIVAASIARNVDAVTVDGQGNTVTTHGHVQVLTPQAVEFQIYYVRVDRRGPVGWQLASHATTAQVEGASPTGVFRPGGGVTQPRVVKDAKPQYTSDAMRARIQGAVFLEVVVNADGAVGDVRVVRSLDRLYGLDDEAVKAVKMWRFAPGARDGQPVPVLLTIEMAFTMK